jgi:cGMP-dependent protein kinase
MELGEYDYFGERSLLDSVPRAANVIAKNKVVCLMIRKPLFDEVLGRLRTVLRKDGERREGVAEVYYNVSELEQLRVYPGEIPFFQGQLYRCELRHAKNNGGIGHFGTLRRIQRPPSSQEQQATDDALQKELEILRMVHKPQLVVCFSHPTDDLIRYQLFRDEFVFDLKSYSTSQKFASDSKILKYTIKTVTSCLIELHRNRGILSRAVTPEAILVTSSGQLQLTDFRFAKVTSGSRTFTACGTPEYMSPEQVQGTGHGFATDFWGLGVLMVELMTGSTPWSECSEVELYEIISNPVSVSMAVKEIAIALNDEAKGLLTGLLKSDPDRRLMFEHSMDIEAEPYFKHINTKSSPLRDVAQNYVAGKRSQSPSAGQSTSHDSASGCLREAVDLEREEEKAQE